VHERLRQPPGPDATCWTLQRVAAEVAAVTATTPSGIRKLLRRWGIRLRRGRAQVFSPDPAYLTKRDHLLAQLRQVAAAAGQEVVLFVDEFTLTAWPLLSRTWYPGSGPAPCAVHDQAKQRRHRLVAALDGQSGRVVYHTDRTISRTVFVTFLEQVLAAYPQASRIVVVLDNWPVHHAPEVSAFVEAQPRLGLCFLPTYSPWLNPIEHLWDELKDAVLRLHRQAGDFPALQAAATSFLDRFASGSPDLLRVTGLLGEGRLAQALQCST
jgi:transposase